MISDTTGGDPPHADRASARGTPTRGDVIAHAHAAGLVDELHLHLAPMVLGQGTPLFHDVGPIEMRQTDVELSPHATHLTYELG